MSERDRLIPSALEPDDGPPRTTSTARYVVSRRALIAWLVTQRDRMKWLAFTGSMIALCSSLSGCGSSSINANNPIEVTGRIESTRDELTIVMKQDDVTQVTSYTGPNCAENPVDHIVLIRAWQTRDEPATYQIYVSDRYTHERLQGGIGGKLYDTAHDIDGNALPTEVLARSVNWCGTNECQYIEAVGIAITRPYLEDRIARGLTLKISGTRGDATADVPAAYVRAFLKRVPEQGM